MNNIPIESEAKESKESKEDRVVSKEDIKNTIEEKTHSNILSHKELEEIAPELVSWLQEILNCRYIDRKMIIKLKRNSKLTIHFYTNDHCYTLNITKPDNSKPGGYLGCTVSTRKPRTGENWNRGNDLPDGEYSKGTFNSIVKGIVRYEMKDLELWE